MQKVLSCPGMIGHLRFFISVCTQSLPLENVFPCLLIDGVMDRHDGAHIAFQRGVAFAANKSAGPYIDASSATTSEHRPFHGVIEHLFRGIHPCFGIFAGVGIWNCGCHTASRQWRALTWSTFRVILQRQENAKPALHLPAVGN